MERYTMAEDEVYCAMHGDFGISTSCRSGADIVSWAEKFMNCSRQEAISLLNRVQQHQKPFSIVKGADSTLVDSKKKKYKLNARKKRVIILGSDRIAFTTARRLGNNFEVILVDNGDNSCLYAQAGGISKLRILYGLTVQHVSANRVFFEKDASACQLYPTSMSFDYLVVCPTAVALDKADSRPTAGLLGRSIADSSMFRVFIPCALDAADKIRTNLHFQVASNSSATEFFSHIFVLPDYGRKLHEELAKHVTKVLISVAYKLKPCSPPSQLVHRNNDKPHTKLQICFAFLSILSKS